VFDAVKDIKLQDEMIDLAKHIIGTKEGTFDPATFDDRYDQALAELVKAKIEGRKIKPPRAPKPAAGSDLLDALRQSAGASEKKPSPPKETKPKTPPAKPRATRKAG
jgi:DNA end-binding protein Ku